MASSSSSAKDEIADTIDRLRHLNLNQSPTVILIGDKKSGKSSLLESVSGITLLGGIDRTTRVPFILRLQNTPDLETEFNGKIIVPTDEASVADSISSAIEEIAGKGKGKGISNTPLTLTVKKDGVPDLTLVDLPGITRVPLDGQPEDVYEQISDIIMEYITPEDNIILNVLSAGVDFSTSESIRMSKRVDKAGHRTLAVITKADKYPQDLLEKGALINDKAKPRNARLRRPKFKAQHEFCPIKGKKSSSSTSSTDQAPIRPRSTRTRRLPKRLEDYVVYTKKF
ncbi:hypothetical protein ACS0TY_002890 [Phlomoides rotata]